MVVLGGILAMLLGTVYLPRAVADPAPIAPDLGERWRTDGDGPADLPPPPPGYRMERKGKIFWVYPFEAESDARALMGTFDTAWPAIVEELGGDVDLGLSIRIGRNPSEMRALAPTGHPPPEYATGVAYPSLGVVLLTLTAPETWKRPNLDAVLTHELSHIALHRAVSGAALPRWFVEGLAIHQAGEHSLDRIRVLWQGALGNSLIPLSDLSRRFPSRPHEVNLAYAQSAHLVTYLQRGEEGPERFRRLLSYLREGTDFEQALRLSHFLSLRELESEWTGYVHQRFRALPLVLTGSTLWVFASLLLFVAYRSRRVRAKRLLAVWEAEEAAYARAEETLGWRLAHHPGQFRIMVSGEPPQGREPGVPTVQHDGRNHTLH